MKSHRGTVTNFFPSFIDTGGPGTYSQLLIIKEYMTRMANDIRVDECDLYPADYFDIMGGLVTILLGYLKMNVDDAIDALVSVASAVFPPDAYEASDREENLNNLKEAVEALLEEKNVPLDMKMHDRRQPSTNCKIAIYAASSANLSHPAIFRTYTTRGTSLNPTIVEAICATMAVPSLFAPVKIGPRLREQSFVGGAVGTNNPTRELLKEAANVFGKDRRVAQILSIGAGRARLLALDHSGDTDSLGRLVKDMAADCGIVARELATRLHSVQAYLRLNVDRGMESIKMHDWASLGAIESHTSAYVEITTISEAIDASLRHILDRIGSATLGQISKQICVLL
ncbi:hypothetical protein M408DRAFT_63973 [Serendipita vermifera MAFF 305830]|uniref:PNPLA domain-containing protein n=1 Tax=Serendipita vermifera MAFF 305830 TaxID=933852 RepID=A0A0C2X027_SERVB|nr:hypothetical protein M408DRAFT_63973 [Serendipita vermifera MAFF 305830]